MLPTFPHPVIQCRLATSADVPFVQETVRASWQKSFASFVPSQQLAFDLEREYATSVLQAHVAHGPQQFWIIEDSHSHISKGFVAYEFCEMDGLPTIMIHKFYLQPLCTGLGFGAITLAWLKDRALLLGACQLVLLVNRRNRAQQFYQRHGFSIVGKVDTEIGQSPLGQPYWRNDYRMVCPIALAADAACT